MSTRSLTGIALSLAMLAITSPAGAADVSRVLPARLPSSSGPAEAALTQLLQGFRTLEGELSRRPIAGGHYRVQPGRIRTTSWPVLNCAFPGLRTFAPWSSMILRRVKPSIAGA